MDLGPWHIDDANVDDEYIWIDFDSLTVMLKRSSEGVIIDVFPLTVVDEPLDTLGVCYHDFPSIFFPEEK